MAAIQLDMLWPEAARVLIEKGQYAGATDAFLAAGQDVPDALLAAWNATLNGDGKGPWEYKVERYRGRVRMIAKRRNVGAVEVDL